MVSLIGELTQHPSKRYKARPMEIIDRVVVHHSATRTGSPAAFARYHVHHLNWPGIAYHYVIALDGTTYKCQPIGHTTWHARGANRRGIGVCLVGNHDETTPPPRQYNALLKLIRELREWRPTLAVIGHREVPRTHKSCPGRRVDLDQLRRDVG